MFRTIFYLGIFSVIALLGALLLLFLAWPISALIGYFWGVGTTPALCIAMSIEGVLAILVLAMTTNNALRFPWQHMVMDSLEAAYREDKREIKAAAVDDDDGDGDGDGDWFELCPCGSQKPFARCCGRKSFNRSKQKARDS